MSFVKRENYINIQGWMVTDLYLKGNELLIYAMIYGFTQDGQQWFEGSRQYLADWCNSTKQGISKNLNSLIEKGYIIKDEYVINNVKFCRYKANLDIFNDKKEDKKEETKSVYSGKQSLHPPGKQSLPNNINIYNLKVSKKEKEEQQAAEQNNEQNKNHNRESFDEIIERYMRYLDNDFVISNLLKEFLRIRYLKNKPLTNEVLAEEISKLIDYGKGNKYLMREIASKTISNCWATFFPLSDEEEQRIIEEYSE